MEIFRATIDVLAAILGGMMLLGLCAWGVLSLWSRIIERTIAACKVTRIVHYCIRLRKRGASDLVAAYEEALQLVRKDTVELNRLYDVANSALIYERTKDAKALETLHRTARAWKAAKYGEDQEN